VRGDLGAAVMQPQSQKGKGILTGGGMVPLALAELGLIDEYDLVVHPRIIGHGPTLLGGLSALIDLKLVAEKALGGGIVARRYVAAN